MRDFDGGGAVEKEIMEIIEKKLSEITPYENNPRKNDDAVEYVANSIREFGWKVPIVIDRDGVIIAGHTRYKAAQKLGYETVPCIMADDLTPEQVKAYRLADNKVSELAGWDFEMLDAELEDIDLDMSEFGFDFDGEEGPAEIGEDEVPQPPEQPKSKRGQIYKLGRHRLMCGDATDEKDVAKLANGDKANMVFTDPPYNVAIGSKNAFLNSVQKAGLCCTDIIGDKGQTDEEIGESLWKPAFKNLFENAQDNCSIYVTMPQGGTHMMMMMMMMSEAGWQVKHELMWLKNAQTFSMGRLDYDYKHEPIAYGWKRTHNFYGGGQYTNSVWEFNKPRKSDLHPTMKPVDLIENALLNSSKKDDIVFDLFGGSGSTLIACEQTGRICYMMEFDPHYVDVIIERWETMTGEKAVLLDV